MQGVRCADRSHFQFAVVIREFEHPRLPDLPDTVVRLDSLRVVDGTPRFHWTLSGPGGTGSRIHVSGYEEWTMNEDGLIRRSRGHMDTEEYQRQLEEGAPDG